MPSAPVALSVNIGLRAFSVLIELGGFPYDGAIGRCVMCSMTAPSMVADMVFSNVERYRPHLALIKALFRSVFPSSFRMHYSLCICRLDSLHPPLTCLYHPLMPPSRVYTPPTLYRAQPGTCPPQHGSRIHFLHAVRNVCHAGSSLNSPSRTVYLAISLQLRPPRTSFGWKHLRTTPVYAPFVSDGV